MSDIDFSFEHQATRNRHIEEIKRQCHEAEDHRRRVVKGRDPHAKPASSWKVKELAEKDDTPPWTVTRAEGKPSRLVENRPPEGIGIYPGSGISPRSIFELEITEPCFVGGNHVGIGDRIRCFAATAVSLISVGRVKVIEEIRPSEVEG